LNFGDFLIVRVTSLAGTASSPLGPLAYSAEYSEQSMPRLARSTAVLSWLSIDPASWACSDDAPFEQALRTSARITATNINSFFVFLISLYLYFIFFEKYNKNFRFTS
jgi:hypothetical protein